MDEHRQHVILAADDGHIVLELGGVHLTASPCQHLDDVIPQTFVVHLDVPRYGIVGTRRGPETTAAPALYCIPRSPGHVSLPTFAPQYL